MRALFACVCLIAAALAGPARAQNFDAAHVDQALSELVASGRVVGVSLLVYQHDREVYFGAFGMADREAGRPMARNTLVRIFSMTKPLTGAALMSLYEEGRFSLDDPIAQHAPVFADLRVFEGMNAAGAPILVPPRRAPTIRDLTRHTAGFTGRSGENDYVDGLYRAADPMNLQNTLEEAARRIASAPLLYHPGERWRYGDAIDVEAYLIERLSGQRFADFLQQRLLGPLNMRETSYYLPESARGRFAAFYRYENGAYTRVPDAEANALNFNHWPLTPGGWGLVSTLDDYMRFARMMLREGELDGARVLQPETVRLMMTNHLADEITDRSWLPSKGQVGHGINAAVRLRPPASAEENPGEVGEYFWDGLASTLFWIDPRNDLAAVMFVQIVPFDPVRVHHTVRSAVYEALPQ